MEYRRFENTVIVRMDRNEDHVLPSLRRWLLRRT